ncbi:glycosyltransferase family 4 protein [Mucilaginibacter limnophilus]|uniref:Glycosyltransferase family 4 protein n=1 Tax=Mucilaginibacter limnophilus TaxID=1932778 RepID=A0A437MXY9_9SPHI|nr:glycosyltransferase [Mucilaginibacter limnophilus]RVU02466.1 glycosyltransferase family 4 protein [Mucilaginibacter limnophilus]
MKIAIVHDDLVRKGGAEQVALSFKRAFPDAPVYTLTYDALNTYPEFYEHEIKTSWFGKFIKSEKNMKRYYFPFGILAMQQLDLRGYHVILQSTTHCAKYIKCDPTALVITYCHNPFRLVWSTDSYEKVRNANYFKKKLYHKVISYLKRVDEKAARRTDWFITNSHEVVPRIKMAYQPKHEIAVINPPVKCSNFYVANEVGDYYLVVSRFESYKKVDMVIDVFNETPDKKLVIVGKGSREKEIKAKAGPNITFLSGLNAVDLADLYAHCKAFIFPQLEDYGITPLEANASGRPVLAYGKGGVLDTMIPFKENPRRSTAIFFDEQTKEALMSAIRLFEIVPMDSQFIRQHAETFDESRFIEKIRAFVGAKYYMHTRDKVNGGTLQKAV